MSYDLNEQLINDKKAERDTLEAEITELGELKGVYRVEEKDRRDEIERDIEQVVDNKREAIRVLRNDCIEHFLTVIVW